MTRSLQSLPSNLAMEVLDKFSYADLDNVRSKTGFMLGIVKRLQVRAREDPLSTARPPSLFREMTNDITGETDVIGIDDDSGGRLVTERLRGYEQ